ncbi:MAG: HAMP domain-containing sensor histidine kinase [Planctomycetota bacterium]
MIARTTAGGGRRPWFGVLGLELTVLAAATILLFGRAAPALERFGYWFFDVEARAYPSSEEIAEAMLPVLRDPSSYDADPAVRERIETLTERYTDFDTAFCLMDRSGRTLLRSPDLEGVPASVLESNSTFRVAIDGIESGYAMATMSAIGLEGERIGMISFVSMFFEGGPDPEYADSPLIELTGSSPIVAHRRDDGPEEERLEATYDLVRAIVRWVVPALSALVLGAAIAWIVTRRVVRLADQTAKVGADGMPGPFDESGHDEIARLGRALNAMRSSNAELLRDLESRDRSRREWVAQVSHDLRTPLTSLSVCLERIHARGEVVSDAGLSEAVRLARHDTDRVRTLAEDLLEAARLEGDVRLAFEPVLPREVVRQALQSVRPLAERDGVALTESAAGGAVEVVGDGARLVRACENLLRNAVRHARTRVEVRVESTPGRVRFSVRDDGLGFGGAAGAVDLRRVGVIGDAAGSSGLGLLVVERIAAAHDGGLFATNLESGGAEVGFEIARVPGAAMS